MLTRKQLRFALDMSVNLVLPWLTYTLAKPTWGEAGALVASAMPPLLWSIVELIWHRRLDALSVIVLSGIALSLIGVSIGGDPRLLLVRESLISGVIGIVFLVTVPFRKPLIHYLARATIERQPDADVEMFDEWAQQDDAKRMLRCLTLGWGIGLTVEALLRGWLAWHWEAERFLLFSPFISYGMIGLLTLWTWWYRKRAQERELPDTAEP